MSSIGKSIETAGQWLLGAGEKGIGEWPLTGVGLLWGMIKVL